MLVIFRYQLLHLFGSVYKEGVEALLILIVGGFFSTILAVPFYYLEFSGNQRKLAPSFLVMTIVNVILAAVLIPSYGIIGRRD